MNTPETTHETTATTEQATGLAAGAQALGLDGRLLAAQIINFIILLLILRKFLYGPLVSFMETRRQAIEASLKKADEIEEKHKEFQIEHEKQINEAKAEAAEMIANAKAAAEGIRQETLAVTQAESEKMLAKAAIEIEEQKVKLLKELKHEVGALVVAATGKIVDEKVADKLDSEMIDDAIRQVK
jgi:F-type H+-transporting ATPase subunit b